jgi:DNA polymerase epsilon subunit 1
LLIVIFIFQVPLEFRALVDLGCLCVVDKAKAKQLASSASGDTDTFDLSWLQFKTLAHYPYMSSDSFKTLYFYHHKVGNKAMYGLFLPSSKKALVIVLDTVRSNQMPNLNNMYNSERSSTSLNEGSKLPESDFNFEIRIETDLRQVQRQLQKALTAYKAEKRGPTVIAVQAAMDFPTLTAAIPVMGDFPLVPIHIVDMDNLYSVLDWQRVGAKAMLKHFLKSDMYLQVNFEEKKSKPFMLKLCKNWRCLKSSNLDNLLDFRPAGLGGDRDSEAKTDKS